jgi:hypothetical protein
MELISVHGRTPAVQLPTGCAWCMMNVNHSKCDRHVSEKVRSEIRCICILSPVKDKDEDEDKQNEEQQRRGLKCILLHRISGSITVQDAPCTENIMIGSSQITLAGAKSGFILNLDLIRVQIDIPDLLTC